MHISHIAKKAWKKKINDRSFICTNNKIKIDYDHPKPNKKCCINIVNNLYAAKYIKYQFDL